MMIYFTSGTVGYPKMVLHTHVSYPIGHIVTGKYWLDLKPTDLHWNLSDTGWAKAAYSNLFGPWIMGAAMFTFDGRGRFDAAADLGAPGALSHQHLLRPADRLSPARPREPAATTVLPPCVTASGRGSRSTRRSSRPGSAARDRSSGMATAKPKR